MQPLHRCQRSMHSCRSPALVVGSRGLAGRANIYFYFAPRVPLCAAGPRVLPLDIVCIIVISLARRRRVSVCSAFALLLFVRAEVHSPAQHLRAHALRPFRDYYIDIILFDHKMIMASAPRVCFVVNPCSPPF